MDRMCIKCDNTTICGLRLCKECYNKSLKHVRVSSQLAANRGKPLELKKTKEEESFDETSESSEN